MDKREFIFQWWFFEFPCGYGLYPGRPLKVMGIGLFFFTLPYWLALRSGNREVGIWVLLMSDRVLDRISKD
jgi:hypothetical protein